MSHPSEAISPASYSVKLAVSCPSDYRQQNMNQPRLPQEPQLQNHLRIGIRRIGIGILVALAVSLAVGSTPGKANAAGGVLTLSASDEQSEQPTITRMELWRGSPQGSALPIRKAVDAGVGVVLDRSIELNLNDGPYAFRMVRGPEYRVVTGTFVMERSSSDAHSVRLPRTIHMMEHGWTSGDCCVPASKQSVPLRMASEDLHVASVLGHVEAAPIPHRQDDDPIQHQPRWIREDAVHHDGLIAYGEAVADSDQLPSEWLAAGVNRKGDSRIAIENPFAWPLPVWLASGQVDGFFLLGDWLRLDQQVRRVPEGRGPDRSRAKTPQAIGEWAYEIYVNMLEAGLRIPPLAGSGNEGIETPIGYNRLYVSQRLVASSRGGDEGAAAVASSDDWWDAAWAGCSVATNGPLLRPSLGGKLPGHVFRASMGETLQLRPVLSLTTRDPVEYLEVIHNGQVHYRARLDEFAKAGGMIPPITFDQSGWVMILVQTQFKDHFRAAISAPWYVEFDGRPRVTRESVKFFQDWLSLYETRLKRLPPAKLSPHIPYVRSARKFWADRSM